MTGWLLEKPWRRACVLAIGIAVLGLAAAGPGARAQQAAAGAAAAVEARQAHFKDMGKTFKALSESIKDGAGDRADLAAKAGHVQELGRDMLNWFPPGSGPESGADTEAKAEIWAKPGEFKQAAEAYQAETVKLAALAPAADPAALADQLTATGKACGNCHQQFRVKK